MIARDKNSLGDTILHLLPFRDLRRSSKELLGPTVTTDHGTKQRLVPRGDLRYQLFGHILLNHVAHAQNMIAPPLDQALYCRPFVGETAWQLTRIQTVYGYDVKKITAAPPYNYKR